MTDQPPLDIEAQVTRSIHQMQTLQGVRPRVVLVSPDIESALRAFQEAQRRYMVPREALLVDGVPVQSVRQLPPGTFMPSTAVPVEGL